MMQQFIWLSSLVLVVFGHHIDKPKLSFEQFGNVARFFQTGSVCGHEADIKTQHDDEGRLTVSFKTKLRPNESDDDLCKCIWRYLNQNCVLKNVDRKCVVKGTQLTIFVTGPANPNYNPLEPFPKITAPVTVLADILQHYPSLELADHQCTSTDKKLANGDRCLTFQCKLTPQSPEPEKICASILETVNQCEWLGDVDHDCSSKDGKVFFAINGN